MRRYTGFLFQNKETQAPASAEIQILKKQLFQLELEEQIAQPCAIRWFI